MGTGSDTCRSASRCVCVRRGLPWVGGIGQANGVGVGVGTQNQGAGEGHEDAGERSKRRVLGTAPFLGGGSCPGEGLVSGPSY